MLKRELKILCPYFSLIEQVRKSDFVDVDGWINV